MSTIMSKSFVRDLHNDWTIDGAGQTIESPPALFLSEAPVEISTRSTIFARMSADDYCALRDIGTELRVPAGETVFFQGEAHDGIFLIEAGSVRTFYIGPSGREITLA